MIASKQATTRAIPRGHGSIGRPKGQSNSKNHKAGGKREGCGRKKIPLPKQKTNLASYFTITSSTTEESASASAPTNDEVATSAPNNDESELQNESHSKDDESDVTPALQLKKEIFQKIDGNSRRLYLF